MQALIEVSAVFIGSTMTVGAYGSMRTWKAALMPTVAAPSTLVGSMEARNSAENRHYKSVGL